jgi:hypothetical protein
MEMLSRRLFSLTGLALALAGCERHHTVLEPPAFPVDRSPADAAQRAFHDLQSIADARNYPDLGFKSLSDVQIAKLETADPVDVFLIGVDRLRAFTPASASVEALLAPSQTTFYPVSVMGEVRSSVSVVKEDGGYRPSQLGVARLMQAYAKNRKPGADVEEFLVRTPGVNLDMLGRRRGNDLYFVLLFPRPELGAAVGVETPALQIVQHMVPLAQHIVDDLPG